MWLCTRDKNLKHLEQFSSSIDASIYQHSSFDPTTNLNNYSFVQHEELKKSRIGWYS